MASYSSVFATFSASIKSVGTACVMSAVGFYLHQRNFITKDGKRALALMSQQVTFPLYFFTKIIYCNQDWSDEACPDVTSTLSDTWMLLFWPVYMVGMGLLVGHWVTKLTRTPLHQKSSVLACVAFANNTALPITLLNVIHTNFPSTSDLGRIDPTLFLSVYLVVYPILQWSLGGWILAPDDEEDEETDPEMALAHEQQEAEEKQSIVLSMGASVRRLLQHAAAPMAGTSSRHYRNVINNKQGVRLRKTRTHGLTSNDEGCYMTELDLAQLEAREIEYEEAALLETMPLLQEAAAAAAVVDTPSSSNGGVSYSDFDEGCNLIDDDDDDCDAPTESYNTMKKNSSFFKFDPQQTTEDDEQEVKGSPNTVVTDLPSSSSARKRSKSSEAAAAAAAAADTAAAVIGKSHRTTASDYETDSVWETIRNILNRTLFQPPVIGALLGIFCAVTPARGYFVDIVNRHGDAPLQWMFDGLYKVGQIAVPDNMLILGCNISASYNSYVKANKTTTTEGGGGGGGRREKRSPLALSRTTMVGIMLGKMLVMPFIGISTTYLLKTYVLDIPAEIAGAFYLVLMIVFLTPTANNVMIMIELANCAPAVMEGVANTIALEYAVAPIILSLTMSVAIGVASGWS